MNIYFDPNFNKVSNTGYVARPKSESKASSSSASEETAKAANVDRFTPSSQAPALSDNDFATIQTNKIAESVKAGVPAEKVADIKQRVATGEYQPNNQRIAEHMLGYLA